MTWIDVTWDDIEHGEPCDAECCPLARALYRATGVHFIVNPDSVELLSGHGTWPLPQVARQFIDGVDSLMGAKPIRFLMPLPSAHELASLSGSYERSSIP